MTKIKIIKTKKGFTIRVNNLNVCMISADGYAASMFAADKISADKKGRKYVSSVKIVTLKDCDFEYELIPAEHGSGIKTMYNGGTLNEGLTYVRYNLPGKQNKK